MSESSMFLATIYRNVTFDADGGGRLTLQFSADQEVAVVRLLTMRHRLLEITVKPKEQYS